MAITVASPTAGRFLVVLNEYQGTSAGELTATVRVFAFGRIAAELAIPMDVGDGREVVMIVWPTADELADGVLPCFEDLTDFNAIDQCG